MKFNQIKYEIMIGFSMINYAYYLDEIKINIDFFLMLIN
jgi:hypothetical protein